MKGCDSAYEPSLAQAQAAKLEGITWWAFYISGPGALHNWSAVGTVALQEAGLIPLPIYLPAMAGGKIASRTPAADAQAFVSAYRSRGVDGAGALDTEASMRGDPWTAEYEQLFTQEMGSLGQTAITYAGGFTLESPPTATYRWWIIQSTSPASTECYQNGNGGVDGVEVDFDYAGDELPLAHFGYEQGQPNREEEMFVRDPGTGEICLCGSSGAVNLGTDWPAVLAAYSAAGVPLVLIESASLQARFVAIASH
jgi:hypothetical protein